MYDPTIVKKLATEISLATQMPVIYIEKDIWLTYLLRFIYAFENAENELAFKGGTSLVKCHYGYYRFSEDLDFTWIGEKKGKKANRRYFQSKYFTRIVDVFGFKLEETQQIKKGIRHSNSGKILNYFFVIPKNSEEEQLKIKINVSFYEDLIFPVEKRATKAVQVNAVKLLELKQLYGKYATDYFEEFTIPAFSKEEIASEKIRALFTRKEKLNRSRDIVDLYYLSKDVNFQSDVFINASRKKIKNVIETERYGKILKERIKDLDDFLQKITGYAAQEPIYLTKINQKELDVFSRNKLKPAINQILLSD